MLSCKEATRLMSDARERELRLGERLQLKLHLAICDGCANFRKQMDFLQRACRGYLKRQGFGDDA
jgi:hypothetical protein